jgi:hypothetical protein
MDASNKCSARRMAQGPAIIIKLPAITVCKPRARFARSVNGFRVRMRT